MNNPLPSIPSHIIDSVDENPSNSDETEQDSLSNSRKRGEGGGKKRVYNRRSKPYCDINKQLRMEGKEYIGEKKTPDGLIPVVRKARSMGPACKSIKCKQSTKTRFCHLFTEEIREITFKHFWNESWETRKAYVRSLVEVISSRKRNRPTLDARRRQIEFKYHLRKYGIRYQVCQTTFLNTLGIKHGSVKRWTQPLVAERFEEMEREKQQNPDKVPDKRRRRGVKSARSTLNTRSSAPPVVAGPSQQISVTPDLPAHVYQMKPEAEDVSTDEGQYLHLADTTDPKQEALEVSEDETPELRREQSGGEPYPSIMRAILTQQEQAAASYGPPHTQSAGMWIRDDAGERATVQQMASQMAALVHQHAKQVASLEARLAGKTAECCHLQAQLGKTEDSEAATLRQELSDLSRAYAKLGVKYEASCTELDLLTSQLKRGEGELAESRQRERQLEQQVNDLRQQLRLNQGTLEGSEKVRESCPAMSVETCQGTSLFKSGGEEAEGSKLLAQVKKDTGRGTAVLTVQPEQPYSQHITQSQVNGETMEVKQKLPHSSTM